MRISEEPLLPDLLPEEVPQLGRLSEINVMSKPE